MKYKDQYYKDNNNKIHFLSVFDQKSADYKNILKEEWIPITENEAFSILNKLISISETKLLQIDILNKSCSSQIIGGCSSEALGSSYIYPTKETDQNNLAANVLSSLLPNLSEDWTTLQICCDSEGNWNYLPHTAEQIQKVGNDVKDFILNCRIKYKNLCDKVEKAKTIEVVQTITW